MDGGVGGLGVGGGGGLPQMAQPREAGSVVSPLSPPPFQRAVGAGEEGEMQQS